jgi:hypothetical protein
MITTEQIAQWRALMHKAAPGPWVNDRCSSVETNDGIMIADFVPNVDDVDFIIIARDALSALLDEVERLRAIEQAARGVFKDARFGGYGDYTHDYMVDPDEIDKLRDALDAGGGGGEP